MSKAKAVEYAAGTVPFRYVTTAEGLEEVMVLLVHRTKWQDVSFPKGKLDKGESMPAAAVRETLEETGLQVHLGVNLGTLSYQLKNGKDKVVQYWAAEVHDDAARASTFTPNDEIEALEWVPLGKAAKRLSYRRDREILEVVAGLAQQRLLRTFAITMLRHCQATPKGQVADHERPLTDLGKEQAQMLIEMVSAFGPQRAFTSDAVRCVETVTPTADALGIPLKIRPALSQDSYNAGDLTALRRVVGRRVQKRKSAILCSHRPVLPEIAREISLATGSLPGPYLRESADLPPGGFSVFHLSWERPGAGIIHVETYPVVLRP